MPKNCSTMYIFHTHVLTYLPIQQPRICISAHSQNQNFKSVTLIHAAGYLGELHQSMNFLHSLLCSCNSHTNHYSEQNESYPPHISTLLLKDTFQYNTHSQIQFFQVVPVLSGIPSKTLPRFSHTHKKKPHVNFHDT